MKSKLKEIEERVRKLEKKRYGLYLAKVEDVDDPEGQNRIRVKFNNSILNNNQVSNWALAKRPKGGDKAGESWLPEIDDTVLVSFRNGDVKHPVWEGCTWVGNDGPPENSSDGVRVIKSRNSSEIRFEDKNDKFVIEAYNNVIEIKSDGVKINDHYLMTEDWLDWFVEKSSQIGMGNMGAPVPINPSILSPFLTNYNMLDKYKTDKGGL